MFVPEGADTYKVYEQKNAIQKDSTLGTYYISTEHFERLKAFEVQPNDIIVSCAGTIGETYVLPKDIKRGVINQALMYVRLYLPIIAPFYLIYFDFIIKSSSQQDSKGTAIKNIPPFETLKNYLFPLPPLQEQARIIDEIEKWFTLIDTIEDSKRDLQEIIKATKSKVLNLAIHGKLVSQDPADEPAAELLKRIAPHATPCDTSHYENLPHNWSIARLESLCQSITSKKYQIKQSEIKEKGKYPVISQSANYIEGYSDLTDKVYSLSSPLVIFGDHTRIVKYVDFNFIVGADGVKILQPLIFPKYFYFLTEYSSTQIENRGYGRHYSYLSQYEVPIPPIEEQEKIVSKLEEIFETIDKITAEL